MRLIGQEIAPVRALPVVASEPDGPGLALWHRCDHCGHPVVSAADLSGRPCRVCAPYGRLVAAGCCTVDPTPPGAAVAYPGRVAPAG